MYLLIETSWQLFKEVELLCGGITFPFIDSS